MHKVIICLTLATGLLAPRKSGAQRASFNRKPATHEAATSQIHRTIVFLPLWPVDIVKTYGPDFQAGHLTHLAQTFEFLSVPQPQLPGLFICKAPGIDIVPAEDDRWWLYDLFK